MLWEGRELAHLEGTQTLGKLKAYGEYLDGVWEQLREFALPLLPSLGEGAATKEAFLWAFGALKTNALRPFSQPQSLRIAPSLQMVSHSRRPNCNTKFSSSGIFKKDETLDLVATRPIREGDPILYDFDPTKTEIDILVDYGVFDTELPLGGMELNLEIDESDPYFDDKCDVVEEVAKVSGSFLVSETDVPGDVLAFLRLSQLKDLDAFLLEPVFRNEIWGFMQDPVSADNESNVCESMIQSCQGALDEFPTTYEEDVETLKGLIGDPATKQGAERMAVEAKVQEKRTLRGLLQFFTREKSQMSAKEFYQERRLKSLGLLDLDGNSTY